MAGNSSDKLMVQAAQIIDQLRTENALLREELAKARGTTDNTVKGAISAAIQKDLAGRRQTQVRKNADAGFSDHYLDLKISKRRSDRQGDLDRIAKEGACMTLEALRKRAGSR